MDEPIKFFNGRTLDKLALIDRGELIFPPFLRPCRLKILMVVDGYAGSFLNVSFSHSYFGLSAVLDTLRNNPEYFVKFDITRAHRQTDTFKPDPLTDPLLHERYGPHYESFRFTQAGFNIDDYDQVWLFGARSNENDPFRLTDAELEVLSRWMDQRQGGLFATGDHADLGAALCARVPRARTMRRWTNAQGVPQPTGLARHDTNLKGHDATYTFDDESDDIPMKITPRFYPLASFSPFQTRRAPHPVLCGTDGVIDVLPDHPHEGWVYEDADVDLTRNISFLAYNAPEYPTVAGVRPMPEVIAHAHVLADHTNTSDTNKGAANPSTFGAIGAYDGHRANVGRVVVDSTWHHWFDVNLTGRPASNLDSAPFDASNPKTLGYLATAQGQAEFSRIQNYFRNVAMWLASPPKQSCMFFRATWGGILRYPAVERLHARLPLWELGESARDAIGRRAGQCTLRRWIIDIVLTERFRDMFRVPPFPEPNPCLTCPPFELLEIYLMGGVTRELLKLAYSIEDTGKVDEAQVATTLATGLRAGVTELTRDFRESLGRARNFSDKLAGLAAAMPSEKIFLEMQARRAPRAPVRPKVRKARRRR
jgi:hypothetical protein